MKPRSPAAATRLYRANAGFTLTELLVVLIVLAILSTIAVTSLLGFRDRAHSGAAKSRVRAAVPAVEAFFQENGTYVGMTVASLQTIDANIAVTVDAGSLSTNGYCIEATSGTHTYSLTGPGASVVAGSC